MNKRLWSCVKRSLTALTQRANVTLSREWPSWGRTWDVEMVTWADCMGSYSWVRLSKKNAGVSYSKGEVEPRESQLLHPGPHLTLPLLLRKLGLQTARNEAVLSPIPASKGTHCPSSFGRTKKKPMHASSVKFKVPNLISCCFLEKFQCCLLPFTFYTPFTGWSALRDFFFFVLLEVSSQFSITSNLLEIVKL